MIDPLGRTLPPNATIYHEGHYYAVQNPNALLEIQPANLGLVVMAEEITWPTMTLEAIPCQVEFGDTPRFEPGRSIWTAVVLKLRGSPFGYAPRDPLYPKRIEVHTFGTNLAWVFDGAHIMILGSVKEGPHALNEYVITYDAVLVYSHNSDGDPSDTDESAAAG